MAGLLVRIGVPTLAEVQAMRAKRPISKGPTRLETKAARDKAKGKAWEACKRAVDKRDGMTCRCCRRRLITTIELVRNRAEHHHIVRRRKEPSLLTDPRNVVLLCPWCHGDVTRHELEIIGEAKDMFTLRKSQFLNADKPLQFASTK